MPKEVKSIRNSLTALPALFFERQKDWAAWLDKNHATSPGVWLKLAKKASSIQSVTYDEALEVALCYGCASVPATMISLRLPVGTSPLQSKLAAHCRSMPRRCILKVEVNYERNDHNHAAVRA